MPVLTYQDFKLTLIVRHLVMNELPLYTLLYVKH